MTAYTLKAGPHDLLGTVTTVGYRFDALVDGTEFGDATAAVQAVASQLLDGDIVRAGRFGNKTVVLRIAVGGATAMLRAKGAAALALWAADPTTLLWSPPDGTGALTVTKVMRVEMAAELNLHREARRKEKVYTLTLECLPFGYSVDAVTSTAEVVGVGTDVQVNAADALTGWTGLNGTTLAVDTTSKAEGTASLKLTPSSASYEPVNGGTSSRVTQVGDAQLATSLTVMSDRPYVSVSSYYQDSEVVTLRLWVNGIEATHVASVALGSTAPGWGRYTFRTNVTGTATTIRVQVTQVGVWPGNANAPGQPAGWRPRIDDVRRSGTIPGAPGRESIRRVTVAGTARADGSVQVSHPTQGLGDLLIYSHPALGLYTPSMMTYGQYSTSAVSISGKRTQNFNTIGGPATFDYPLANLPRGTFQLLGYGTGGVSGNKYTQLVVTVATFLGTTQLGPTVTYTKNIDTASIPTGHLVNGNPPAFYPASVPISLPSTDVPLGSPAIARITFKAIAADGSLTACGLDELFLLAVDDYASLVICAAGGVATSATAGTAAALGTANNRVWLDAATLDTPRPALWAGTLADRSDSYRIPATRFDALSMPPPYVDLFVANSGGAGATVTYDYVPAFRSGEATQ